eukprot:gene28857-34827_t
MLVLQVVLFCISVVSITALARPCSLSCKNRAVVNIRGGGNNRRNIVSPLLAEKEISTGPEEHSAGIPNATGEGVEDTFADRSPPVKRKVPWWSISRVFDATESFFSNFFGLFVTDPDILYLISRGVSAAFWVFFALSVLGTVGFDTKPLLSLLSVAGFTLGFAAKDMISSTFSGLIMLFLRPFERDMVISVAGHRGRVVSMDVRFLKLEGADKSTILIPLSKVYGNSIVIENAKGHRH